MHQTFCKLLCWIIILWSPLFSIAQQENADNDQLLSILQEQLDIQLAKYNRPELPMGYLSFEVTENTTADLLVSAGSPYIDNRLQLKRNITVRCAVGFTDAPYLSMNSAYSASLDFPLYNDKENIARCIEQATRQAYQDSYSKYLSILRDTFLHNHTNRNEESLLIDTFHYEASVTDNFYDHATVLEKFGALTQPFSQMQYISDCSMDMRFKKARTYHVSSRNGAVVANEINTSSTLKLCTGGRCLRQAYEVQFPDDLPVLEALQTDAAAIYDSLAQFSDHPIPHAQLTQPSPIEGDFQSSDFSAVVFQAMGDEMAANLSELSWQGQYPPYAIRYLISDVQRFEVTSSFGSTQCAESTHHRAVSANVSIGNDVFNNSHYEFESGYGKYTTLPLDNNYTALRQSIREATFAQYKNAVKTYIEKCDYLKEKAIDMSSLLPDRSVADRADVRTHPVHAPIQVESIDLQSMQTLADELSKPFGTCPVADHLTRSEVKIRGYRGNFYILASDSTRIVQPVSVLQLDLEIWLDNPHYDSKTLVFRSFDELPDIDSLKQWVNGFITEISELRTAPTMDEIYDGPVLLTGDAAAKFFTDALRDMVAYRQPLSAETSPAIFSYETKIDQRIFSPILDITSTDTASSFGGMPLIGSYTVDAEGVAPVPDLELVRRGELVTLFANREPTERLAYSNGHQRIGMYYYWSKAGTTNSAALTCAPGVTRLNSHKQLSISKLKKQLLQMAREQGYRYAYIVTDYGIQRAVAYRIDVNTGRREMVSNSMLYGECTPYFRHLAATSNHSIGYNTVSSTNGGQMPVSVIVPNGLLFNRFLLTPATFPFTPYY